MPSKTDSRREFLACLAALAAVVAALLHESLLGGKGLTAADGLFRLPPWKGLGPVSNYLLSDQYLALEPLRRFFHARWALWNPYISCGVPNIALMQAAPLYPVNLLLSRLDPFRAGAWAAALKLFAAGAFMALYMRELSVGWACALYSGVAFSLSGFMIVWLGHPHVNSACLLPMLFYLIERKSWPLFALAFGAMALGGHAPTIAHVTLAVLAYGFWTLPNGKGRFAAAVVLGFCLAAPQLLPFLEYQRLSSSAEASAKLARWADHLPLKALSFYLMPLLAGSPAWRNEALGAALGFSGAPFESYNERTGYVGVLTLLLAAVGLVFRRDRRAAFFGGAGLLCLAVVFGLPGVAQVLKLIPVLSAVNNTRLLLLVGFFLSALAGLGLEELPRLERRVSRVFIGGLSALGVLFLLWLYAIFQPVFPQLSPSEKAFLGAQVPLFLAGAAAAAAAVFFRAGAWLKPLCVLWTAAELLVLGAGYNPEIARESYYPRTKAIEFLQADSSLFRILGIGWTLAPNTGLVYGLQDARGQDFTSLKRYEELISGTAGDFFFYSTVQALPPCLASLGVKYLLGERGWKPDAPGYERVYDGEIAIWRAKTPPERARVVYDAQVLSAPDVLAQARSPHFDPGKTVLLEEEPLIKPGPAGKSRTNILSYEPDDIALTVSASSPAFLVLFDTWYPGWRASVNARPAKIYRADYGFRAIAIPAGESAVRFVYDPPSYNLGLSVAGLALLSLIGLWRLRA